MEQAPIGKKKETRTLNFIEAKTAVLGEIVRWAFIIMVIYNNI